MATTPSTPSTTAAKSSTAASSTTTTRKAGLIVELAGLAAFITGSVLAFSLHHTAIALLCAGGTVAIAIGWKLHKA